MTTVEMRRVRRTAVLCFVLACLIVVASMFATAAKLRRRDGDGSVSVKPLGVPMFSAEREDDTSQLNPGIGVLLLLVGLPAVGAGAVFLRARKQPHRG